MDFHFIFCTILLDFIVWLLLDFRLRWILYFLFGWLFFWVLRFGFGHWLRLWCGRWFLFFRLFTFFTLFSHYPIKYNGLCQKNLNILKINFIFNTAITTASIQVRNIAIQKGRVLIKTKNWLTEWIGLIKVINIKDEEIVTDIPWKVLHHSSDRAVRNIVGLPRVRHRHWEIMRY